MIVATLMLIGAGVSWALVGVVFSRAAEKNIHPLRTVFASALFFLLFSWTFLPRWGMIAHETRAAELFLWMLVSGSASCAGLISLQAAMQRGTHGMSWGIAQGALAVPFALGVLLFRDKSEPHRWLALVSILAGIALISRARYSATASKQSIVLACAAFIALGIQQTAMSVPSRWAEWTDVARLRIPFFSAAIALISGLIIAIGRPAASRGAWFLGLTAAVGNLAGQVLIVQGLDRLAACGLASIAYPIAVSTSMVSFILWRVIAAHERLFSLQIISLALILAGAVFIAL